MKFLSPKSGSVWAGAAEMLHGGIYAIASGDTIMLKRLQLIYPTGKLKIIGDNPHYEPIEAAPDEIER